VPSLAWLDGRLVALDAPQLSIADRGFQLGDGLFESLRARRGALIEWPEHIARLRTGAEVLAIPLVADEIVERGVRDLLAAEGLAEPDGSSPGDAAVRITVTRGALGSRGTLPPGWIAGRPTVAIQVWPYAPPPGDLLENGIRAVTSRLRRDPTSPLAGVKSTSRADHVLARLDAERAGADDALFLTLDGHISEASSSNVFAIAGDRLVTPPLTAAILAGTTRTWLLEDAAVRRLGLRPVAVDLMPAELLVADEAFLSASVAGIVPLTSLDGRPIGTGRPGPRTLALREARERWIDGAALAEVRRTSAGPSGSTVDGDAGRAPDRPEERPTAPARPVDTGSTAHEG
jgi:branched-chain amino acid aminotransferase